MSKAQKPSAGVIPVDGQVRPDPARAAFDAWARKRWGASAYLHCSDTSGEWDAWQAATRAARAAPVAPTPSHGWPDTDAERSMGGLTQCDMHEDESY